MEYEIIDFVKAHPILYERKYSALKYATQKMEKWRQLGRKLRKDPHAIRLRWRGLRNHFAKKFKEKGHNDDDDALGHAPRWQYYNHMKFLSTEYENISSIAQCDDDDEYQAIEEDETDEAVNVESFDINEYLKEDVSDLKSANPNGPQAGANMALKKTNHLYKNNAITEACREMSILLQKAKQHIMPPSHNQVFFNSLAMQVDQAEMMAMDQMRLQQRVLELVTQEILISQEQTLYQ